MLKRIRQKEAVIIQIKVWLIMLSDLWTTWAEPLPWGVARPACSICKMVLRFFLAMAEHDLHNILVKAGWEMVPDANFVPPSCRQWLFKFDANEEFCARIFYNITYPASYKTIPVYGLKVTSTANCFLAQNEITFPAEQTRTWDGSLAQAVEEARNCWEDFLKESNAQAYCESQKWDLQADQLVCWTPQAWQQDSERQAQNESS